MLYKNRQRFEIISKKTGQIFSKLKLSPDTWTALSLVLAIACAYTIYTQNYLPSIILFTAASFSDFIDGAVARHNNIATRRGAYLDTIADRYVEFIILFALYQIADTSLLLPAKDWLVLIIFGSLMTTYSKAAGIEKGIEIKGGIMERAERLIFISAIILSMWLAPLYTIYLLAAMAVLTNITATERILIALKEKKR